MTLSKIQDQVNLIPDPAKEKVKLNKKKMRFTKLFGIALLSLFLYASCNDEDQMARLKITLVDSPASYDEVNVDIQGVKVHSSDQAGEEDGGWVFLEGSDVGVRNLLEFTAGKELTLYDTDFPTGMISQIRLILGSNNTYVVDGESKPLTTPSAQQSGLKLQVHEYLEGGITYNFKLDFEVARSIVNTGNGDYILKPVIHVTSEAKSGAIKGSVTPAEESVVISVMDGDEVIRTTYAIAGDAGFVAAGVPEGVYTLTLDPGVESDYAISVLENVETHIGKVTDVGLIELALKEPVE